VGRAGNGSGGFLATDVLAPLGADISGAGTRCLRTGATRTPGLHAQPLLRAGNSQRQLERNIMPAHDQLLQQAVRGDPC